MTDKEIKEEIDDAKFRAGCNLFLAVLMSFGVTLFFLYVIASNMKETDQKINELKSRIERLEKQ